MKNKNRIINIFQTVTFEMPEMRFKRELILR